MQVIESVLDAISDHVVTLHLSGNQNMGERTVLYDREMKEVWILPDKTETRNKKIPLRSIGSVEIFKHLDNWIVKLHTTE